MRTRRVRLFGGPLDGMVRDVIALRWLEVQAFDEESGRLGVGTYELMGDIGLFQGVKVHRFEDDAA